MINSYSEEQIAFILEKKKKTKLSWPEIAEKFNKKFMDNRSFESLRKTYERYKHYYKSDNFDIKKIKEVHRAKKNSSYNAKENRLILDYWMKREDLLETIKNTIKNISLKKYNVPKIKRSKSKSKKNMTIELLFSDVHYGKYIDNVEGNFVDIKVIRSRVREISESVVGEIHRESKSFNVERCIIGMIGDLIENSDFHGKESSKGCEFSTSRQVFEAIDSIFKDLILPIAMTGIKVDIPCVTGNHDRVSPDKTYVKPGEDNLTFIIYKTLELLCKQSNLKNVSFDITTGLFTSVDVYGNTIVYEHGDELKNTNRATMETQMHKRQSQLNKVVHFYRVGHFHEPVIYGQGKMMVNGSVPGQDDYATSKGFWSEPLQIMNYYVKTNKRTTCFFRSFPIYLQNK